MDGLNGFYASKSVGDIKYYSDAATALRTLQEFVKEVQNREGGSKEYTSRIRTLINELDNSVAMLASKKPLNELRTKNSTIEKTRVASTLSVISEHEVPSKDKLLRNNQSVFISYAWGDEREEIVNQIDQSLQKRGVRIIRDKRDLEYKGSIKEFMERIGQGDCVIVVISDKYLRSPNCMFELVEIAENKQFQNRIFPVVWIDANIYDPIKRIGYIRHWEEKRAELAEAIKSLDPANLQGIREEIDLYDRIRDKISGLTSILKDMNTLTPDIHQGSDFRQLYDAIEKRLKENPV